MNLGGLWDEISELRIGGCMMLCAHPLVGTMDNQLSLAPPSWKIQVQYGAIVKFCKLFFGLLTGCAIVCKLFLLPCLVHSVRCGGSFPALFLLLAVLGAAMAGAALASLFYRLAG